MTGWSASIGVLGWIAEATIKGSVVIMLVASLQWIIGARIGARWRHALWLLVLLRLAIPFAPTSQWSVFNLLTPADDILTATVPTAAGEARVMLDVAPAPDLLAVAPLRRPMVESALLLGWLSGLSFLALRAVVGALRARRTLARSTCSKVVDPRLTAVVEEARQLLNIRRNVGVIECDLVPTPALHGIRRPALLFPKGLAAAFDRDELRHIVLHELWHLRRGDVAVNWLLSFVQALHWFNPFVWYAMARIREERELACDELALSCLEEEERVGYGRTILKLLERFRATAAVPALVGIVNHKQQMKRRMMMIATFRNRTRFSILFLAATAFVGSVALTDAKAGQRIMKSLDPASHATVEKLHQKVSIDLTGASIGELLSGVSSSSGVVITQSPDVASSRAQSARFTVKAVNTPAHLVLMESLMPFGLAPKPEANGVSIVKAEACAMKIHRGLPGEDGEKKVVRMIAVEKGEGNESTDVPAERKVVKIIRVDKGAHGKAVAEGVAGGVNSHAVADGVAEGVIVDHQGEKHVFVHKMDPESCRLDENGKLHKNLNLSFEENGVKSEGSLSLEIDAPPVL